MQKYSIISYIFNDYEMVREIEEKSPNCEYILITDNPNLQSKTWKIICNPPVLNKFTNPFDKCFYIRYHSFEFCNTEISITMDHSIKIKRNLDKFVNEFIDRNVNFGVCADISSSEGIRNCINHFKNCRNYNITSASIQMNFLNKINYNKTGCIEAGLILRRKNEFTKFIDDSVWNAIRISGINGCVDRLDQTIFSMYMFNLKNSEMFIFDRHIIYSSYLQLYIHKTETIFRYDLRLNNKSAIQFNNEKILPYFIE